MAEPISRFRERAYFVSLILVGTILAVGAHPWKDPPVGGGLIKDGDTQWMTAGSGLLHIEKPPNDLVDQGGLVHGIQLWVNLPAKDKMLPPKY